MKNFSKLKTFIDEQRVDCANFVATLAGDFIAPSLLSALDHGAGMVDLLNKIGISHVCFGNHESDVPYAALQRRVKEFKGVWLNSNMTTFEPALPSHHILKLTSETGQEGARAVAFLGLLIGGPKFADMYRQDSFGGHVSNIKDVMEAHGPAAAKARAEEPDLDGVIPLTHQDQKEDEMLAALGEYPLVLGGHDHAVTVTSHGPRDTPVVKAGQDAHNATVIDLVWAAGAPRGAWPSVSTRNFAIKKFAKDAEIDAAVKRAEKPMRELESATLCADLPQGPWPTIEGAADGAGGNADGYPSSVGARLGPCTMGMYLATALKECTGSEVCLINSGAVRADTQYTGVFRYADLTKECPFPSENICIQLDGATLSEAVCRSRKAWMGEGCGPRGVEASEAFQHDMHCQVNSEHKIVRAAGAPLDPARLYRVLVDTYDLAKDPTLSSYAKANPTRIPQADAGRPSMTILVEYFCRELWRNLADSDRDGVVTLDEINQLFDECDSDNSGEISEVELTKALEKRVGEGASKLVAKQMMALVDEDESGTVSREELNNRIPSLTHIFN